METQLFINFDIKQKMSDNGSQIAVDNYQCGLNAETRETADAGNLNSITAGRTLLVKQHRKLAGCCLAN